MNVMMNHINEYNISDIHGCFVCCIFDCICYLIHVYHTVSYLLHIIMKTVGKKKEFQKQISVHEKPGICYCWSVS